MSSKVTRSSIVVAATPDVVFDVLDDAYAYPRWVIGTRRIRYVDSAWPAVGSRFHHAIGTFVAELHDSTMVLARDRPRRIDLEVRFRPTGVALVCITVATEGSGSRVTLEETPTQGPIRRLPAFLTSAVLSARNALSLRQFRRIAEAKPATCRGSWPSGLRTPRR